jgi:hypothetical protein
MAARDQALNRVEASPAVIPAERPGFARGARAGIQYAVAVRSFTPASGYRVPA